MCCYIAVIHNAWNEWYAMVLMLILVLVWSGCGGNGVLVCWCWFYCWLIWNGVLVLDGLVWMWWLGCVAVLVLVLVSLFS